MSDDQMSDRQAKPEERPCLHCAIVDVIDDFYAENPIDTDADEADDETAVTALDANEVVTALAKTVAELTCSRDATFRQSTIEQLMREIMHFDAEFREHDALGAAGSDARH